jgi:hypothetical protein
MSDLRDGQCVTAITFFFTPSEKGTVKILRRWTRHAGRATGVSSPSFPCSPVKIGEQTIGMATVTGLNSKRLRPENTRPWVSWRSERDSNRGAARQAIDPGGAFEFIRSQVLAYVERELITGEMNAFDAALALIALGHLGAEF